ncbi:FkbM family methyltransferase [Patescibacteria group bacterium]|nr:FkbM family methyltransferase [Patescibacteria group bacterium]
MNKLSVLQESYSATELLDGSRTAFFLTFWLTKLFSLLQRTSSMLDTAIHMLVARLPKNKFIIKNKTGIFAVEAFDDSTTICSDYFEEHLRDWLTTPTTQDVFVDIGANRGLYSIIAPTRYSYAEVIAFEPNPEVVHILRENISLNNLTQKITVHDYALGSNTSTVSFTCDPLHKGGGRIVDIQSDNILQVPVRVFDDVVSIDKASKISFIKIDTEGFELEVLAGMSRTLTNMLPGSCLMIESSTPDDVNQLVSAYNFKLEKTSHHDHLFIKKS